MLDDIAEATSRIEVCATVLMEMQLVAPENPEYECG